MKFALSTSWEIWLFFVGLFIASFFIESSIGELMAVLIVFQSILMVIDKLWDAYRDK